MMMTRTVNLNSIQFLFYGSGLPAHIYIYMYVYIYMFHVTMFPIWLVKEKCCDDSRPLLPREVLSNSVILIADEIHNVPCVHVAV